MNKLIFIILLFTGTVQAQAQDWFLPKEVNRNGIKYLYKLSFDSFMGSVSTPNAPSVPDAPELKDPPDRDESQPPSGTELFWWPSVGANMYEYQLAISSSFLPEEIIATGTTADLNTELGVELAGGAEFFWRVRASADGGSTWSDWSVIWSFTTIF